MASVALKLCLVLGFGIVMLKISVIFASKQGTVQKLHIVVDEGNKVRTKSVIPDYTIHVLRYLCLSAVIIKW